MLIKYTLVVAVLIGCNHTSPPVQQTPFSLDPTAEQAQILEELRDERATDRQKLILTRLETILQHLIKEPKRWALAHYLLERLSSYENAQLQGLRLSLKAQLHLAENDYAAAEIELLAALAADPQRSDSRLELGLLYVRSAQFQKALPHLLAMREHPRALPALIASARQLDMNDYLDSLCSEVSTSWAVHYECALFEAQNRQSPVRAQALLEKALAQVASESAEAKLIAQTAQRIEASRVPAAVP